ncbi:hypothetical protein ACFL27_02160 [candidate division CSSED10-310 bacterium]|uniref:Glycosyltransferase RgtA/B/C/D-like domain-containing protein n=1 Tax=candidate division CSSED10-310 bacterium TaxID=2855610 RepID=A0ABV6YS11_UNCC1
MKTIQVQVQTPDRELNQFEVLIQILCVFIVFLVVIYAPVKNIGSDPYGCLLTSQSIIEHKTIKLDAYASFPYQKSFDDRISIVRKNGHYYYFFPLGTSVLCVPLVWVANLLGEDILVDEVGTHELISALSCALIFFILLKISRCYLPLVPSIFITAITFFGSSLISTNGTGLWSSNFATLFICLSLYLIVKLDRGRADSINFYLLGFFLFTSYFCRPTALLFIFVIAVYLFVESRIYFLKTMTTLLALFLGLVVFSFFEYGQVLPDYYNPFRLQASFSRFLTALYGNLLSPARGLLIFSPFFIIVFGALIMFGKRFRGGWLFRLSLIYLGLHLVSISKFKHWWAGWSFGPRLFTEAMPMLFLLTIFVYYEQKNFRWLHLGKFLKTTYLILGLVGIGINTLQGLYNTDTLGWNEVLKIDNRSQLIFDWQHPQFLATRKSIHRLMMKSDIDAFMENVAEKKVPKDAAILISKHAGYKINDLYVARYAAQNYKDFRLSFNIPDMVQSETFYFTPDQYEKVQKLRFYSIKPFRGTTIQGYFKQKIYQVMIVSVKDEAKGRLPGGFINYMVSLGSKIDSLTFRGSYIAIIFMNKIILEKIGNDESVQATQLENHLLQQLFNENRLFLYSAGMDYGNKSSIQVNGVEYSLNNRGFNVAVFDNNLKCRETLNFDTHIGQIYTPDTILMANRKEADP